METLYIFSIVFAWMIAVIHGLCVLINLFNKRICGDKIFYGFLVALAWLITNHLM